MTAYYNENDKFAATWLQNLIAAGLIAHGDVDNRDIRDIRPGDVRGYTQCHFFAGIGVWSHALRLAGWRDARPVWTGSCPCQPFSAAGKRRGVNDDRHLWPVWRELIRECKPATVFGEQVASADGRSWLASVRTEMEGMGYAIGAADLCAASAGAHHIRQRLWFVGDSNNTRSQGWGLYRDGADERAFRTASVVDALEHPARDGRVEGRAEPIGRLAPRGRVRNFWAGATWLECTDGKSRAAEPGALPLAHGAPSRVGRLRAYGNAIVPQVAAEFIGAFMDCRPN